MPELNMYTIQAVSHDEKTGSVSFIAPQGKYPLVIAQKKMDELYRELLKKFDLEDNNACDENGESCPGGYIDGSEAVIYAMPEYAMGCLVELAAIVIRPVQ